MFPKVLIFGVAIGYPRGFTTLFHPVRSADVRDCACRDTDVQCFFIYRRMGGVDE